jgi:hypothetical protein
MRHLQIVGIVWVAVMSFVSPGGASAQEVAQTFSDLSSKVLSRETVYVTDDSGHTVRGRLLAIAAETLVLETASRRVEFSQNQVERVRVERRDSLKNGILIGLAIGAASALFLASQEVSAPRRSSCSWSCKGAPSDSVTVFGAAAFGGVVGIGVGAVVDALRRERRLVYERPSNDGPSVSIAPLVTGRTAGVAVRLRLY